MATRFQKRSMRPGMPVTVAGSGDALTRIDFALSNMRCSPGRVGWHGGVPVIYPSLSAVQARLMEVVAEYADYLDCAFVASLDANQHPVPVDPGEEAETLVKVWKPWLLRMTPFDALTRDGITYTYSAGYRVADDGDDTETQYITPSYSARSESQAGELLHAIPAGDGEWQDLNTAGRCWAVGEDVEE